MSKNDHRHAQAIPDQSSNSISKQDRETSNSSVSVQIPRRPSLQSRVASTTDARKRRLDLIQQSDRDDFHANDQIEEIDDDDDATVSDHLLDQNRKAVVDKRHGSLPSSLRGKFADDLSDSVHSHEDDDDDDEFLPKKKAKRLLKKKSQPQQRAQSSDSDSVVVIGSLLDEQNAASSKPKTPSVEDAKTDRTSSGGYRQAKLTLTKRKSSASLSNAGPAKKRIQSNQLFSAEANGSTSTASTSVARRGGTSVAETRVPTQRSTTKWTKVREMCQEMQLDGNFTAVDVGRVNMGIVRINCSGTRIVLKNWMLINLDTLSSEVEKENPQKKFKDSAGRYSNEDHCHVLYEWVCQQSRGDGIFDSSVVLIESQSFTREMKALQTAIHLAVVHSKPSIMVRLNNPELGPIGIREANFVSSAVIVSANSVKTCYAPFFPRVTETLAAAKAKNPGKKFKAFGHAEANRDPDDNVNNQKQYAQNKKNSVLFGQQLISVDRIIELLPRMSEDQKKRFRAAKKDDIYDALWIVLFGIESWLPALYSRRERGYGADSTMYGAVPQRRYRTCDAMFEFAESVGTSEETIVSFQELLHVFRTSRSIFEDNGEEETVAT